MSMDIVGPNFLFFLHRSFFMHGSDFFFCTRMIFFWHKNPLVSGLLIFFALTLFGHQNNFILPPKPFSPGTKCPFQPGLLTIVIRTGLVRLVQSKNRLNRWFD